MLLWYSNILNERNTGVFESKVGVGDFYRKETAVKIKKCGVKSLFK
jgi:hypothetical protein